MKKSTNVESIYMDILKHKVKFFRKNRKIYFRLSEDTNNYGRDLNAALNKKYIKFIKKLVA